MHALSQLSYIPFNQQIIHSVVPKGLEPLTLPYLLRPCTQQHPLEPGWFFGLLDPFRLRRFMAGIPLYR